MAAPLERALSPPPDLRTISPPLPPTAVVPPALRDTSAPSPTAAPSPVAAKRPTWMTESFNVDHLRWLVLDEADRILDLGFKSTLTAIIDGLPRDRQSLLFSATQTRDVRALASLSLRQPQYIGVHEHSAQATPNKLQHHYMVRPPVRLGRFRGLLGWCCRSGVLLW